MACRFILISERHSSVRMSFENQTDFRRGFIHQPCLPNWAVLLPMCLNSTQWWFSKRTFNGGLLCSLCSCFSEVNLRQKQADLSPCIHHCTHKSPQNFLAFNFNLKFFTICFLWLLEINCQPWVSKPCCTKTLLGWLLVDLFQEDRSCHRC